ncbi:MAG: 4-alpha-glucanotransferase [Clostridiales bacterium]|jgi:4-alpha-glucanotransferase|nr:4-alpha-glucanotransferase [Clostridiales bacterium]
MKRTSGILVHPTSFPGPYGIGDLGAGAYEFIDFLKDARQKVWQILPLGPTSFGDSPYQGFSTFAGTPYLISPDLLLKEGYLQDADLRDIPAFPSTKVDYGPVIAYKMGLARKAYANFKSGGAEKQKSAFSKFIADNSGWLNDFSLFVAAKNYFIEQRRYEYDTPIFNEYREKNLEFLTEDQIKDNFYGAVWSSWPESLAGRDEAAVREWTEKLADEIEFNQFLQYEFFRQWGLLKEYANDAEISIIGDIPIFVAMDSSDVWARKELFQLDANGYPLAVAGVPPDYFSETGQLWGNPLYFWPAHKKEHYAWWVNRINSALKLVDILRIDHFRGFESYWSVPYGEKTAVKGKWVKGPGIDLFETMGALPIIAEDLGVITEEVAALRDSAGFPGMRVLQFAFGSDNEDKFLPHNFETTKTVVYTGTHDNNTTLGWYTGEASEEERDYFRRYMNISGDNAAWDMIRLAFSSTAKCAVAPIQDVMNLGAEHRMNTPGQAKGNWQFRYTREMLTPQMADGLRYFSSVYNR